MIIQTTRPARRVLHVCYCCADVDGPVSFFVRGLGLRETMRTTGEPTSGAILGLDREVRGIAAFVYDSRGPRTSPAIEVQSWLQPPLDGRPFDQPNHAGVQSLGFAVHDLDAAVATLETLGARVSGRGQSPVFDASSATLMDPFGMAIDLVEQADVPQGEGRVHHLRVTCSDHARSIEWYEGLGFERVGGTVELRDGAIVGLPGPVHASACRLRLPDEPMEVVLVEWREPKVLGRHYRQPNHAGWYRLAVGVDDTRASYDAMSDAGWRFDRAPMLISLDGTPVPDMWITFTSDPDGVPFELVQRPRSAFAERSA
jgi:catechol 2,3-dioxygenase-like lactoylglutathione lyase family enzyme